MMLCKNCGRKIKEKDLVYLVEIWRSADDCSIVEYSPDLEMGSDDRYEVFLACPFCREDGELIDEFGQLGEAWGNLCDQIIKTLKNSVIARWLKAVADKLTEIAAELFVK